MPTPARSGVIPPFRVSPELVLFLDALAADLNVSPAEAVRLSLGLMRIAVDARAEGNKMAIVTPDCEIDQEIGGY